MRFTTQDPDIETILRRIDEGDYDLQPDFQRGDVWTESKQKRLIDTILRGWHIPPIHLVARDGQKSDVLDGQQRLTAIRTFVQNGFAVDGNIEPFDPAISHLDGLRYASLPAEIQKRFRRFTIRLFELTDYAPAEPHELFFRLNQPTNLTEAEKRNAFIGEPRNQVKRLVDFAAKCGLTQDRVGFSNARMAYDDIVARFLITVEAGSLTEKLTASRVTERYRSDRPFEPQHIAKAQASFETLFSLDAFDRRHGSVRPNRATLQTWLYLFAQLADRPGRDRATELAKASISYAEEQRWARSRSQVDRTDRLLGVFQDRSTARVADVSSVVLRDLIAWMIMSELDAGNSDDARLKIASEAWSFTRQGSDLDEALLAFAIRHGWGDAPWF